MLVGLGTKQAILIVEFAKDAMEKDGLHYVEAAMQAAKLRFRAVMMTNIAFILGLLPLITASGAGAGSRHSIGMTVFGGMIAVSFIGSIMVPAFFVAVNTMKEWFGKIDKKTLLKNGFSAIGQQISDLKTNSKSKSKSKTSPKKKGGDK